MKQENILIFGDSYSTFEGYNPEGYAIYYPHSGNDSVDSVTKTWWHMLAQETSSHILLNNSWSGSTVCNTGYNGDCSTTSSFICRLKQLAAQGFFEKNPLDRVLVFGGTNDSWTGNALGTLQFQDWTADDLKLVLPGICYFVHSLLLSVPREKVHIIINTELRPELTEGLKELCCHYGVTYTELSHIHKIDGHPTYQGMTEIKDQVLSSLKKSVNDC